MVNNNLILRICLFFGLFTLHILTAQSASALRLDDECKNVEIIYARGSGNGEAKDSEGEKFTGSTQGRLGGSITKNSYYLGTEKYGEYQYKHVDIASWTNGNALGAKTSSGYANDYGKSVDSGVGELFSYLSQRYQKCKTANTKFILGGYSQGAQVIGQTLPKFSSELKKSITYVALFGDPKLHLPEGEGINPPACQGKNLSLYRRVIANCNVDEGELGARKPYLPTDMNSKTGLWCYDHDFVCGVTHNVFDNEGHGKYKDPDMAIDQASIEIATALKKQLPSQLAAGIDTKPHGSASGKPDVVYIIDTTGSMAGKIDKTKEFVRQASAKIQELNGRVALVAYRDRGDTYTAKILTDFSGDLTNFRSQLDQLSADGGGDDPEATLHALTTAFNGLSWRNGAAKAAIVLTDASFHEPDKVDGSTLESVAKRSLEIDPVNVYPVVPEYLRSIYTPLAEQTSGQVVIDDGDTITALTETLTKIKERPVAILKNTQYQANPGQEIVFDTSDSCVVDSEITKYQWDFDGDGIFEKESTTPVEKYTYTQKFDGIMQVRLTAANGTIANVSATVKVGTYTEPVRPLAPKNVAVTVVSTKNNTSTVRVSWSAADSLASGWQVAVNGVQLGVVAKSQFTIEISDIDRTSVTDFSVKGIMADGTVGVSGDVSLEKIAESQSSNPDWWQYLLDLIHKVTLPIKTVFSW